MESARNALLSLPNIDTSLAPLEHSETLNEDVELWLIKLPPKVSKTIYSIIFSTF